MDVLKIHPSGRVVASYSRQRVRLSSMLPNAGAYLPEGDSACPEERMRMDIRSESVARCFAGPARPLGLSSIPNSRNPRKQRGSAGITPYARQLVRDAATVLQDRAGIQTMSFLTVTLPPGAEDMSSGQWSRLVHNFQSEITRSLQKAGLPGLLVSVSEYQEKRGQTYGKPALHLHILYQGRFPGRSWVHTCQYCAGLWRSCCMAVLGDRARKADWRSATRIESVRKDCASYLGKYMSKGSGNSRSEGDASSDRVVPRSWHSISRGLGRLVARAVHRLSGVAASQGVSFLLAAATDVCRFSRWVSFIGADGTPRYIAWYADLKDRHLLDSMVGCYDTASRGKGGK